MKNEAAAAMDIGIPEEARHAIAQGLNRFLADTFVLYLKTHAFHWNVVGPQFQTLHLMFEAQYNELWTATDAIAERIRALGIPVQASWAEFVKQASIKESHGTVEAMSMVKELTLGHEAAARTARVVYAVAEKGADEATVDLLTQRLQAHEKTSWMLRSMLA